MWDSILKYAGIICICLILIGCAYTGVKKYKDGDINAGKVFDAALNLASKILANKGTQQLAIAAAQSAAASQIQDPAALAACNQIIAATVPKIADDLSTQLARGPEQNTNAVYTDYVQSQRFQDRVNECVRAYKVNQR